MLLSIHQFSFPWMLMLHMTVSNKVTDVCASNTFLGFCEHIKGTRNSLVESLHLHLVGFWWCSSCSTCRKEQLPVLLLSECLHEVSSPPHCDGRYDKPAGSREVGQPVQTEWAAGTVSSYLQWLPAAASRPRMRHVRVQEYEHEVN